MFKTTTLMIYNRAGLVTREHTDHSKNNPSRRSEQVPRNTQNCHAEEGQGAETRVRLMNQKRIMRDPIVLSRVRPVHHLYYSL
jgi:hypothetical protein